MMANRKREIAFEFAVVVPKRIVNQVDQDYNCVNVLEAEFKKVGLKVERIDGFAEEFIKLAAPLETLGRAAASLHMRKPTHIGMDLQFEWEDSEAFVRQIDGSLFSWHERYHCYHSLIYGIVNRTKSDITLEFDDKEFHWAIGESLVRKLELEGFVKEVFPLHDEITRKKLLKHWALNCWDFTRQPIDEIYSYYGMKIALYFAFLEKYTRWLLFPAAFGLILQLLHFGSMQLLVIPFFFASIILWAVSFFQFWKRKNYALLNRWQISSSVGIGQGNEFMEARCHFHQSPAEIIRNFGTDRTKVKEVLRRYEWFGQFMRFRNDAIIVLSILCLQLPFELVFAHLYEVITSWHFKFVLTAIYLFAIQYFTKLGASVSVYLIKYENNENTEYREDSLVYKVFGLYFMQTYIGVFYHILLHRNFSTLRQLLIQRLIISELFENLMENALPYLKYKYKKFTTVRNEKKSNNGSSNVKITTRVEKEYLKPAYLASVGYDLDGLFDDFLELALQFGMIMMFASAFPPAFAFAAVNNIAEIRTDALKMLTVLKRPVPRADATIGAWLNIFQFLIVMSICTNSALLVWMYDNEGKWKIEPGLAAILVLEHALLLIKFGISHFVPEEPTWVRASRVKNETEAQYVCSKQLLRSISGNIKNCNGRKKIKKTV